MFRTVKIRILCVLYLFSLVHSNQAVNTFNELKRIEYQLSEFKLKYENEQQRIREFVSLTLREFQRGACYNATIETFMHKNDLDPYGNINIARIELDLESLLNETGKVDKTTERTEKQGCDCEKAIEIIRQEMASCANELTNRLTGEQFETQNKSYEEVNEKTQTNIDTSLQKLPERRDLFSFGDNLTNRLTEEFKTQLETQNEKFQSKINTNHQQLLDGLTKSQNTSEQIRNKLDTYLETFKSSLFKGFLNSCSDVISSGNGPGVYQILVSKKATSVYCDHHGRMMIQHQMEGPEDFFNRNWIEYKNGFGEPKGQYWFGLENLHLLTTSQRYELHIDLVDFQNVATHVIYDHIEIGEESDNYRLNKLGGFSGNETENELQSYVNLSFSTFDKDNDFYENRNCALEYKCGWWFWACVHSALNERVRNEKDRADMLDWGHGHPKKEASMFIKLH